MELSHYHIIAIIAFSNALFLAVFSFTNRKGNIQSNRLLSIIYLLFGLLIADTLMLTLGIKPQLIIVFLIGLLFSLLLGPFILLYTKTYTNNTWKFTKKDFLHFLVFLSFLSFVIIKIYIFGDMILWRTGIRRIGSFFILVHFFIYFTLTIREITRHVELKKFFNLARRDNILGKISIILLAFIAIWIINLQTFLVLDVWKRYGFCPYMYSIYFSSVFVIINAFMFINMKYPNSKNRKHLNSELVREENKIHYKQIIDKAFIESGVYKDPEITLKKFSALTQIPYSYLSDFINQEYCLPFRELINRHRIEDAKQLIANNYNKRQTYIEIAYEVGFNSKSTFNLAFKKFVGMSPSEFNDSIKKES